MKTVALFIVLNVFWFSSIRCERSVAVKYDTRRDSISVVTGHVSVNDGDVIAWGDYKNAINTTGWSFLEIYTSPNVSDSLQAYAAGVAEAALTEELIKPYWNNVIGNYCHNREKYCKSLRKFLETNLNFMVKNVEQKRSYDAYWHQIGLTLEQLAGMEDKYNNKSLQPHMNVSIFGLLLLNIMGDVEDLDSILNNTSSKKVMGSGSCSALIKVLSDNSDLYVSQDTWNNYQSMLRILKQYNFYFRLVANSSSSRIPANSASFSSYPGTLQSGDDFYVLSSGLVTLETTIGNNNLDLYKNIKPDQIVFEWIRSIVANRLSTNGKQWAEIFSSFNSGTYNNQWMIVDYKLFTPSKPLQNGLLVVLEQIPTLIKYADMTHILRKQHYWPSYNTPYFESVFNLSGAPAMVKKYGDWFTYDKTPRALIFKRDQKNVKDTHSMIKLMRYNNYKRDPLSRCECNPPYSAENAIAARSDLNPKNGTYPFAALGHRPHGATDMKLTTNKLRKSLNFIAIAGPPYDDVPPFQWSTSDFTDLGHEGQPDLWTFSQIVTPFTFREQ